LLLLLLALRKSISPIGMSNEFRTNTHYLVFLLTPLFAKQQQKSIFLDITQSEDSK
jgi:hypothetical protein